MIERLHQSHNLYKQLEALKKTGQEGESVASRCIWLLNKIRHGLIMKDEVFSKRTKKGEYRVANCVKYDLGYGYRLVTILNGKDLYVPFLGGHDETDKWLDRRKHDKYKPDDPAYNTELIRSLLQVKIPFDTIADSTDEEEDMYEYNLQQRIDQTILRQVFSGLVKK